MAVTATIRVNATTKYQEQTPNKTTLRSMLYGDPNWMSSKGLKMAYVEVDTDGSGSIVSGGFACDILSQLQGWTLIKGFIPCCDADGNTAFLTKPNDATVGNRKMTVISPLAVEVTGAYASKTIPIIVFGI